MSGYGKRSLFIAGILSLFSLLAGAGTLSAGTAIEGDTARAFIRGTVETNDIRPGGRDTVLYRIDMRSNFAAGMTADEDLQKGRITFAFMADDSLDYQSKACLGGIELARAGSETRTFNNSKTRFTTALGDTMSIVLRQFGEIRRDM